MALSVEECKKYLDSEDYSDEQVAQIRDTISAIVSQTIDQLIEHRGGQADEPKQANSCE